MNKNKTAATLILLSALIGCDSKTAPTAANFTDTLNAFYLEHSECLFPSAPRFPGLARRSKTFTGRFSGYRIVP